MNWKKIIFTWFSEEFAQRLRIQSDSNMKHCEYHRFARNSPKTWSNWPFWLLLEVICFASSIFLIWCSNQLVSNSKFQHELKRDINKNTEMSLMKTFGAFDFDNWFILLFREIKLKKKQQLNNVNYHIRTRNYRFSKVQPVLTVSDVSFCSS